jgi:hypothetical protein
MKKMYCFLLLGAFSFPLAFGQIAWKNHFVQKLGILDAGHPNVTLSQYALDDCPSGILAVVDNDGIRDYFQYQNGRLTELIEEETSYYRLNLWNNTVKYVNHFNALNYPDTVIVYAWENNEWAPQTRQAFDYNADAQMIQQVNEQWTGTQWAVAVEAQATYEQHEDTTIMTVQVKNGNTWKNDSKLYYIMNTDGKYPFQDTYVWSNSQWILLQTMNATCNANGKIAEQIVTVFLPGYFPTRQTYVFNANGRVSRCDVHMKQGNQWIYAYTAEYKYDVTAVENIDFDNIKTMFNAQNLTVNSPDTETIELFSAQGQLLKSFAKTAGLCTETLTLPQGIYIVKGSSGWTRKIISQ